MIAGKIPRFNPKDGKGILRRMQKAIDLHSQFNENINAEEGISVDKNANGSLTWRLTRPQTTSGGGCWSGCVWYLGRLVWDFSRENGVPGGALLEDGLVSAITGIYLKVELDSGDAVFTSTIVVPTDHEDYSYFRIANYIEPEEGDPYYALATNTCGDIRIDSVPYGPAAEETE